MGDASEARKWISKKDAPKNFTKDLKAGLSAEARAIKFIASKVPGWVVEKHDTRDFDARVYLAPGETEWHPLEIKCDKWVDGTGNFPYEILSSVAALKPGSVKQFNQKVIEHGGVPGFCVMGVNSSGEFTSIRIWDSRELERLLDRAVHKHSALINLRLIPNQGRSNSYATLFATVPLELVAPALIYEWTA